VSGSPGAGARACTEATMLMLRVLRVPALWRAAVVLGARRWERLIIDAGVPFSIQATRHLQRCARSESVVGSSFMLWRQPGLALGVPVECVCVIMWQFETQVCVSRACGC